MAFIWGTVRAPDQEFLEYVGVTLHEVIPANSHYTAKRQDFRVDQYGRFEGSVPAGEYLVKCDRDRSLREELKHRLEPKIVGITEYWTLPADSSTELNFDLLPGGTTLRLVLVDQNGAVMSEMKTSLWPTDVKDGSTGARRPSGGMTATVGNRTSDKDGICLFEGLRPGRYGIAVEPEGYLPTAKPGQSKLGQRFDPIEYDLSLGTREVRLQLVRAKPVRIWGQVSQEKRDKHVSPARPLMTLILPANEKRSKDRRSEVHIQADGSFEFYVDASEHYAMLELTAGESTVTVPVAWTDFDEELLLPIAFP
jgi:hypothetical protein